MRVIGVTTTLEPAAMQSAMPDWIQPDVQSITVADIKGLQSIEQQQQPQQQQQVQSSSSSCCRCHVMLPMCSLKAAICLVGTATGCLSAASTGLAAYCCFGAAEE